jgi:hypothetical protein
MNYEQPSELPLRSPLNINSIIDKGIAIGQNQGAIKTTSQDVKSFFGVSPSCQKSDNQKQEITSATAK